MHVFGTLGTNNSSIYFDDEQHSTTSEIISLSKRKDKFVLSKLSPPPILIYEYQNYWAGRHLLSIVVNEVEHIHSEIQCA